MKGVSIFEEVIIHQFQSQWETEGSRRASGNIPGRIEQSNYALQKFILCMPLGLILVFFLKVQLYTHQFIKLKNHHTD